MLTRGQPTKATEMIAHAIAATQRNSRFTTPIPRMPQSVRIADSHCHERRRPAVPVTNQTVLSFVPSELAQPASRFNKPIIWDFRFASSILGRFVDRTAFLCKVLAGFGPWCFQRRREGAVSHLVGTQRPKMPFFRSILPTLLPELQHRHRNLLRFALALSRRRRQRRDLPQHAGKQPPR